MVVFVILPLGSWALVANGVFFAALSLRARSRELLLTMVLAASDVLTGESDPGLWVKALVCYDIIFTVLISQAFQMGMRAPSTGRAIGRSPAQDDNGASFLRRPGTAANGRMRRTMLQERMPEILAQVRTALPSSCGGIIAACWRCRSSTAC